VVQVPEPFEPRDQFLVEHRYFTIESEGRWLELRERLDQVRKSAGVVTFVPAREADAAIVLEREHAPPVHLLLVDPSLGVEGRAT
jgi:hypothetical protein